MTLQLRDFKEGKFSQDCIITDCEPMYLGNLDPKKYVDLILHLFPKKCGIINLGGLVIIDLKNKVSFDFDKQPFAQFTVEY